MFYNDLGQLLQKFDYTNDNTEKEFSAAAASPSGQSIVFAAFSRLKHSFLRWLIFRLRVFTYSLVRKQWEESVVIDVPNLYTITSMSFKRDGSKLVVGSLCGAIEVQNVLEIRLTKNRFTMPAYASTRIKENFALRM